MSRRRYKVGEHPDYDLRFDLRKRQSPILNEGGFKINETAMVMSSKGGLEALLYERVGEEDGKFKGRDGYKYPSKIKKAEEALKKIEDEFSQLQQHRSNEGKPVPEEMSPGMQERFYHAQAELDIKREEVDWLQKRLAEFSKKEEDVSDSKVLRHGPIGSSELKGGVLVMVDGQHVKADNEGTLRIADPRSPYNGMMTADYYARIVKPWKAETQRLRKENREAAEEGKAEFRINIRALLPPWPGDVPRPGEEQIRTK